MLYFAAVWTGLLSVCLSIGCCFLGWVPDSERLRRCDRLILSVWLGLVLLAISFLLIAIFLPLSPVVGGIVIVGWLLISLRERRVRCELIAYLRLCSPLALSIYSLCLLAISSFSTQRVTWIDTGLYHYGLIHWLSKYGVTPGLALINRQFGFMSAWFAIAAPFNPAALDGRASGLMNGFVLLLLVLQISLCAALIWTRQARLSDWFLALSSLCVLGLLTQTQLLSVIAVSASPDIPVASLSIMVAWSFLLPKMEGRSNGLALLSLMLAVGAVSLKLTALPLMVVGLGYSLVSAVKSGQNQRRRLLGMSLLILILWLPFLCAEILVSSCPLYPSELFCLPLPWAQPADALGTLAAASQGWSHWYGDSPNGANHLLWLLQQWIQSNASSRFSAVLVMLSLLSGIALLRCDRQIPKEQRYSVVTLATVGIAFMLLKAPLFRFGMGYLLLLPVMYSAARLNAVAYSSLRSDSHRSDSHRSDSRGSDSQRSDSPASITIRRKSVKWPKHFAFLVLGIALTLPIFLNPIFTRSASGQNVRQRLLLPPPLPEVAVKTVNSKAIEYKLTENKRGQCWAADLPCANVINPNVVLRDPSRGISGGFKRL